MSKKLIVSLVACGVGIFAIAVIVLMNINYKNQEIELRSQATAQQETNKATYDKVWKTIQQKAQVSDKYASDFKEAFGGIMNARYEGEAKGSPMFKWIQERNPEFSIELYRDLSQAIEANRAIFLRVQTRLIDIKREHDNLRKKFPGSLFLGSKPELEISIVTSDKTKEAFSTGEENDVKLF